MWTNKKKLEQFFCQTKLAGIQQFNATTPIEREWKDTQFFHGLFWNQGIIHYSRDIGEVINICDVCDTTVPTTIQVHVKYDSNMWIMDK